MYPYITTVRAEEHQETAGRCVTIDPGRSDLLFCVHDNSTPQEPHTFCYTSILRPFYAEERTNHATSHFLYRKLRLSAYINRMKTDQKLTCSLRDHFQDTVLVLGDWSASNTCYHEPIWGKGMRIMLKQHGFLVYLIHEFWTSSCCPPVIMSALRNWSRYPIHGHTDDIKHLM
jgi:hypothetical protein